jgi:8-hydroxy-5-deazaflavin:NADPH oxidoreductase
VKITTVGRGNIGGGLAELWRKAGHEVQELGQEGGDASDSDAVLVAVPSNAIADALGKVTGLDGKVTIDATNALGGRNDEFESLAHEVKSIAGGPTAKAFNLNFAVGYDKIADQPITASQAWCGEDEAREVTEQLIRDAGLEPTYAGGLDKARTLEDALSFVFSIRQAAGDVVFYRFWKPGDL